MSGSSTDRSAFINEKLTNFANFVATSSFSAHPPVVEQLQSVGKLDPAAFLAYVLSHIAPFEKDLLGLMQKLCKMHGIEFNCLKKEDVDKCVRYFQLFIELSK